MTEEQSASGQPVFRHEASEPASISGGEPELIAAVDEHVTRYVAEPSQTWHEIVSPYVHVDIHVVEPSETRPAFTLVTSGMSERPMTAPDGERYAELFMVLPPTWPAPGAPGFHDPDAYWPYQLLQDLARLPHEFATWLDAGHTVPNGDPPGPYGPGTGLCGALLTPPTIQPDGFERLMFGEREVRMLAVIPLYADEMQLKLDKGADALYDLLDAAEVTEALHPDRPSVVPRRRRLFGR